MQGAHQLAAYLWPFFTASLKPLPAARQGKGGHQNGVQGMWLQRQQTPHGSERPWQDATLQACVTKAALNSPQSHTGYKTLPHAQPKRTYAEGGGNGCRNVELLALQAGVAGGGWHKSRKAGESRVRTSRQKASAVHAQSAIGMLPYIQHATHRLGVPALARRTLPRLKLHSQGKQTGALAEPARTWAVIQAAAAAAAQRRPRQMSQVLHP